MKTKAKLINALGEGKTLDELVEILDMRKQTIEAWIEHLHHQGLLKKIDHNPNCSNCPMSKSCPVPASGNEKVYVLAEEAEKDS
ncbi:MAG: helix-turn-helix domain-containing protein [Candidatus Acetothermia bacterium]